jgi:iron uptake system component EfeO
MRRRLMPGRARACAVATACLLGLVACGSDDPNGAGSPTPTPSLGGSPAATSGGSGSGSGSGSGQGAGDPGAQRAEKELEAVTAAYKQFVIGQAASLRGDARRFTDAVRAGDLATAKELYAPSRQSWERIEPIANLVHELDGKLDGRVDDFAGPTDPKFTGWHRLEYLLWVTGSTAGAKPFADRLDADLATLETRLRTVQVTAKAVALGAGELVEEVSKGKITGEEDRYSHTDLWDVGANISGAEAAMRVFIPELNKRDPALLRNLQRDFAEVDRALLAYRTPSGAYKPFTALRPDDRTRLQAQLAALSEELAKLPAALGVG